MLDHLNPPESHGAHFTGGSERTPRPVWTLSEEKFPPLYCPDQTQAVQLVAKHVAA